MSKKKSNKTAIIAVAILLVLVIAATVVYFVYGPQTKGAATEPNTSAQTGQTDASGAEENQITIVVSVTHKDGSEKEFTIGTSAATLREALEQEDLIAGEESEWGLFVQTVDGETVNGDDQEWWAMYSGGEFMSTGVDDTQIADGDHYEFVFTVGW